MIKSKKNKELIYVDIRGKNWSKERLDDLFKALYDEADSEKVKKYYIKSKFLF